MGSPSLYNGLNTSAVNLALPFRLKITKATGYPHSKHK